MTFSFFVVVIIGACASCSDTVKPLKSGDGASVQFETGLRPRAIAVGDLDGDGHPDIAVANADSDDVSVFLSQPGDRLAFDQQRYPAGNEPADVNIADIDRDGAPDLVFANHETSVVTVLRNDGRGRFVPMVGSPFDTGASPHNHGIATSDFDGNGWIDVAVDSGGTDSVAVLFGGPDGFAAPRQFPTGAFVYYRIDGADWTGDGIADVVAPSPRQNRLSFLAWDGSAMRVASTIPAGPASMAVAANFDGDGSTDIAALWNDSLGLWTNIDGRFEPLPGSPLHIASATEVAAGDLDGDGVDEIVVGPWQGSAITIVDPQTMRTTERKVCSRPVGLAVADLDSDGHGEILVACSLNDRLEIISFTENY